MYTIITRNDCKCADKLHIYCGSLEAAHAHIHDD